MLPIVTFIDTIYSIVYLTAIPYIDICIHWIQFFKIVFRIFCIALKPYLVFLLLCYATCYYMLLYINALWYNKPLYTISLKDFDVCFQ